MHKPRTLRSDLSKVWAFTWPLLAVLAALTVLGIAGHIERM